MTPRLLIVNADDFGIHEDVHTGVIAACREGLVRSASIMVNMPAFAPAVALARDHPELEVGIHLNVTSGFCLASPRHVPLLADADGRFRFDGANMPQAMQRTRDLAAHSPEFIAQVAIEWERQVERFLKTGLSLAHVNAHHYINLLHPHLFDAYVRLAEALAVPCRGLGYPILDVLGTPPADQLAMRQRLAVAATTSPATAISNLFDGSDHRPPAAAYRDLIVRRLRALSSDDRLMSVELITHPTHITPTVVELDKTYLWARTVETSLVRDGDFESAVSEMGFRRGGYGCLKQFDPTRVGPTGSEQ